MGETALLEYERQGGFEMNSMTNKITKNITKNIVLIGFAGTGKTVIGRALAGLLGFVFVETDESIKSATGLLPPQVLKKYGQKRFFSEERLVYQKLAQKNSQVIAAGSLALSEERLLMLKQSSVFIWMHSSPELLFKRFSRRPPSQRLSQKLSLEEFTKQLQAHEDVCEKIAEIEIKTDDYTVTEAARRMRDSYLELCAPD